MNNNNVSFEEWSGGASFTELQELKAKATKKLIVFLLLSLIPFVNFVTVGCAIFCYNNISYINSRGADNGNNLIRFILLLYGFFIPPIIVVQVCTHNDALGAKVLGWNE